MQEEETLKEDTETEQEEETLKEDSETTQAAGKKKKVTRKAKTV